MQMQTVQPLKLTPKFAVVMLFDNRLQTVCPCVITCMYMYMLGRLRLHMFRLPVQVHLEWSQPFFFFYLGCQINTENKLDLILNRQLGGFRFESLCFADDSPVFVRLWPSACTGVVWSKL